MGSDNVVAIESAVRRRYSAGAQAPQAALCCPVSYDPKLLEAIPADVLERDYGCGDPTRYVRDGEIVLDLGSGGGKACFLASQVVGRQGRVIGIDMNDDMLGLARRSAPEVARRIGYANVQFHKARIQDLRLDLEWLDTEIRSHPIDSERHLAQLNELIEARGSDQPLIPDDSVDVVVSNCVLNLVKPEDKTTLFQEIHRVLKRGGRAVISDIVSDEDIPLSLQQDPELWSGCISGAFREDAFLAAFERAGFYGISVLERAETPWRTVAGIEFRSLTVEAFKGKEGPCWDQKHAIVYRGPFRQVIDDDGHVLQRGVRTAVCEKTFRMFSSAPYRAHVDLVMPHVLPPLEEAPPFPCTHEPLRRHPRETKGEEYQATTAPTACEPNDSNGKPCC